MAITYPLAFPTAVGLQNVTFRARNAVAYSMSPFTFAGQAQSYLGQMWEADITVAPLALREDADEWTAFLLALKGQSGTFTMGDPNATGTRGSASTFPGSPVISAQSGSTITVTGATFGVGTYLLAGDYVQFGSGSTATLHKVLQDASPDGSGTVELDIWPSLRTPRSGAMVTSNTVGRWRLASNDVGWTADIRQYSVTFTAIEAI